MTFTIQVDWYVSVLTTLFMTSLPSLSHRKLWYQYNNIFSNVTGMNSILYLCVTITWVYSTIIWQAVYKIVRESFASSFTTRSPFGKCPNYKVYIYYPSADKVCIKYFTLWWISVSHSQISSAYTYKLSLHSIAVSHDH